MSEKIRVGILGATGMVGQRFISLLENHPWFEVVVLGASPKSAGKKYVDAVKSRWEMETPIPKNIKNLKVLSVEEDFDLISKSVDLVFSAIDLDKNKIVELENKFAAAGIPVVSNNSAHRWTFDVPIIMPELNFNHLKLIDLQRKKRGWKKGLIVVKPNCSLQSYLPIIFALKKFKPEAISVTTLQAISGAGKTFKTWPEMIDNCIPLIKGEEEKTEQEPLKIMGSINNGKLELEKNIKISATCIRVPASNGHLASVSVSFKKSITLEQIISEIANYKNPIDEFKLPSAPKVFIKYFSEPDRPQTFTDRNYENGMGITCGRFRIDFSENKKNNSSKNWKFVALSHNTIRGAAGGAILTAELLVKKGYIK